MLKLTWPSVAALLSGLSHLIPTAHEHLKQESIVPASDLPSASDTRRALGPLEQVQGEVADHGEVLRSVARAHAAVVLAEGDVEHPVQLVLNAPMRAGRGEGLARRQAPRADETSRLLGGLAGYRTRPEGRRGGNGGSA